MQVVDLARRAGLAALAVTDHDTLGGVAPTRAAAAGSGVEIVAGVEITTEYRQREMHLLGYFVTLDQFGLTGALEDIRRHRLKRFREMIERLRSRGVSLEEADQRVQGSTDALGRRHVAELLVRTRRVATVREAFQRDLSDRGGRGSAEKTFAGKGSVGPCEPGRRRCGLGAPGL